MNFKVCAVIVTYNRLNLLQESIEAILSQKIEHLIVVNNKSTDGTKEYLNTITDSRVYVKHSTQNLGGSGGFQVGMELALRMTNDDLVWVMDDDTIVQNNTLDALLDAAHKLSGNFGYLCSDVKTPDNMTINIATPTRVWNKQSLFGLVQVNNATFVSLLVNRAALVQLGLPISEFFIWFDDTELTERISQKYNSYYVMNSVVIHKTRSTVEPDIVTDDSRVPRYFYFFRNKFYVDKKYKGIYGVAKNLLFDTYTILKIIGHSKNKKFYRICILVKGVLAGIIFNPKPKMIKK